MDTPEVLLGTGPAALLQFEIVASRDGAPTRFVVYFDDWCGTGPKILHLPPPPPPPDPEINPRARAVIDKHWVVIGRELKEMQRELTETLQREASKTR